MINPAVNECFDIREKRSYDKVEVGSKRFLKNTKRCKFLVLQGIGMFKRSQLVRFSIKNVIRKSSVGCFHQSKANKKHLIPGNCCISRQYCWDNPISVRRFACSDEICN